MKIDMLKELFCTHDQKPIRPYGAQIIQSKWPFYTIKSPLLDHHLKNQLKENCNSVTNFDHITFLSNLFIQYDSRNRLRSKKCLTFRHPNLQCALSGKTHDKVVPFLNLGIFWTFFSNSYRCKTKREFETTSNVELCPFEKSTDKRQELTF